MLSRVGLLARRHQFAVTATALSASTAGVALSRTQLDSAPLSPYKSSIIVPTMEAGARAMRLFSTAVLMISDYELDKVRMKVFPQTNQRMIQIEKKRDDCRGALEGAQIAYTTNNKEELAVKMGKTKKDIVSEQKQAVHDAAKLLADVEDQLAAVGDRKGHVHTKAARRLLELCRLNGGCYIKIGQHLANLDYLIPNEYIEVLSSLFDDTPQSSYSDVCRVIEEELGKHPDELFDFFEKEPIASASLAQVHVAYEKESGRKLAVKVQHRGLRETSSGDLFALCSAVSAIEYLFEDFTWGWIADEIAPHLPLELDFANEGKNAERAAKYINESGLNCVVPKIYWDNSSKRVLCMEFEEGFKASDLGAMKKAGLKKSDVAKLVASVFNSQVFLSNFVHCDPHPANVLIREKDGRPQMVLVDHGLYKQIDDEFRIKYAKLWQSLMLADLDGIKNSCSDLGVDEMYTLLAAILTSRPYDEIMERAKTGSLSAGIKNTKADKALIAGYAQHFLKDIIDILGTLPRQMLLLLKMNDCLRHIDYTLGSPTNTLVVAGEYASRALYKDCLEKSSSWTSSWTAWWKYMNVLVRIHVHDWGV